MKKAKSILFIAYYYPPNGTVAFLRNYHIAKYLKPYFNKINIIALKNIPLPLKDDIEINEEQIHRVANFDYRNIGKIISHKKDLRKKANEFTNKKRVKITRFFLDSFPFNILIGEGGLIYIIAATLKGISLIKSEKVTHVFSSFRPIADHIVAYNLKLLFPDLIWVADFRDPPVTGKIKFPLISGLQTKLIKKILSKSNIVLSVSDGVKNSLKKYVENSITFHNGIYKLFDTGKTHFNKFTIAYTGSLYPKYQDPSPLFAAIHSLISKNLLDINSFQLIYAGKDSSIWQKFSEENGLNYISVIMQEVSLSESVKIQAQSHINLLLTWTEKNHTGIITGKFYEYIATKNPILAIVNGERDNEIDGLFKELNCGKVFYPGEIEKLESFILDYYIQWQKYGKINFTPNENELKKMEWDNQIKKLIDLL